MSINDLVPVEHEGQRLLTGKQLASFYGVCNRTVLGLANHSNNVW